MGLTAIPVTHTDTREIYEMRKEKKLKVANGKEERNKGKGSIFLCSKKMTEHKTMTVASYRHELYNLRKSQHRLAGPG